MLNTLKISNFTVFGDVEFGFSSGLNVIVGENGTGKTHVLKLGYLFSRAWPDLMAKRLRMTPQGAEVYLAERLAGLFQVSNLAALILFAAKGHVWWHFMLAMALANVAGSLLGTRLALKHGAGFVRGVFIVVVTALILKTGYDAFLR